MITYVKKSNADKYSFLYEEASEALRTHDANGHEVALGDANAAMPATNEDGSDNTITSLNEYFSYIVQLNAINRRYTILPLDEEVFDIDANTRTITVPPSFRTNGISVQGDEVAEIVYFRINRFYDATDLDTKDIYIQWRSPAVDADGNKITGVSVPWVKDKESEPGYLIFGWPLSSKITQAAGNVEFSVRFYEYDDETEMLTYSLSTLTQTATIKPGLDFDLPGIITSREQIDDVTDLINDRFENSDLTGDKSAKAVEPEFVVNIPTSLNLDLDNNEFRTIPVEITAEAIAADGGQISYYWKKFDLDTNKTQDIDYEITMVQTQDLARVEGKLYYQISSSEFDEESETTKYSYGLFKGAFVWATDPEDGKKKTYIQEPNGDVGEQVDIYEKFTTAVFNSTGKYYVVATNRVRNSTAVMQSATCVVPKPVAPVITAAGDLSAADHLLESNEYKVTLRVLANVEEQGDATTGKNTGKGKITYQWQRKAPGQDEFVNIEDATASVYDIVGSDVESEEAGGVGDGYYKVIITNNLNKEISSIESAVCRVTHGAAKPDISITEGFVDSYTLAEAKANGISITASLPEGCGEAIQQEEGDGFSYQWYRYFPGNSNTETDALNALLGEYVVNGDSIIQGATSNTWTPESDDDGGYNYFCLVTNTYNGTTASRCSSFINITR